MKMKKSKFLSVILAGMMLLIQPIFAEDIEYSRVDMMLNYAANLYIYEETDASVLLENGLKSVLKDNPELATQIIKAGFKSLDDYSEYYTQEEYELFKKNLNHIVYGIGVIIQRVDDYVTVMSTVSGGGAEAAGVQPGDKLAKVDGVDVKGQSVDKVQDLVVGEAGTEVIITFLRDENEYEAVIKRAEVTGSTVESTVLKGNIGYISVLNFASKTDVEFADTLDEFDKQGIKNIIIDLRDNPGGYLNSAVNVASLLVPEGLIVSTVYRNEAENKDFYSKLAKTKYNLAVLVNENTASAAEVLASAIKESGAGILIGEGTYGKGVIQSMYELWDGSAFKITTGKYYTRDGNDINGRGIEPNEWIYNKTARVDLTKYHTFDYKTEQKSGDSGVNVMAGKERLKAMGHYFGNVNDNFDEPFKNAVVKFQAENGLEQTGTLNVFTKVKMENIFYKLEETVDEQLIYAYEYFGGNKAELYD